MCESACEYQPRRPEESVLYSVVAGHLETFLARQRERGRVVPRFVERELRAFLDCGIRARDRMPLERLARYAGRPPLATERLSVLRDGRLLHRLKRRWRDGTTHVIYEPLELIERLAALVPLPKFNRIRYSGVLAPTAASRPMVVPQAEVCVRPHHAGCPGEVPKTESGKAGEQGGGRARNYAWAQLMARVFELDVLACPGCGARMRMLAAINTPETIRKILSCLGLPMRPPPVAPAMPDGDVGYLW